MKQPCQSLFNYHQWVLELSQDSSWQLVTVQDYRQQKVKEIVTSPSENAQITIDDFPNHESPTQPEIIVNNPPENAQTTIDDFPNHESPTQPEIIVNNPPENAQTTIDDFPNHESPTQPELGVVTDTIEGFSHKEMNSLTDYSLTSIRSRASQGKSITGKDGFTYRYNKDPKVLKWVRV